MKHSPPPKKVALKNNSFSAKGKRSPASRHPSDSQTIVDELINREVKSVLKNITVDSTRKKELLAKAKTLLKYKRQLEVSEIIAKESNQFDGFYVGAGFVSKKIGQSLNLEQGQRHHYFEHKMTVGDQFIVRLHGVHGGNGQIGHIMQFICNKTTFQCNFL